MAGLSHGLRISAIVVTLVILLGVGIVVRLELLQLKQWLARAPTRDRLGTSQRQLAAQAARRSRDGVATVARIAVGDAWLLFRSAIVGLRHLCVVLRLPR